MGDLREKVKELEEKYTKKSSSAEASASQVAHVIQLPLWGEDKRGIPNEVVRSALFNARNKKQQRQHYKDVEIAIIGEGRLTYRGEELRQEDENIWLQIMHLARERPLGEWVEFSPYAMLKTLKWFKTKPSALHYQRLRESLGRMQATALGVYSKRLGRGCSISLVRKFEWLDEHKNPLPQWRVWIEPEMQALFGDVHYSALEWEQRLALPTGLATWLHGYYASHRAPYPIKLNTIQDGSGITVKETKALKRLVKNALEELRVVGFLKKGWIEGDLVYVERA